MTQQNVIDKVSRVVKRHGFSDFEHDGQFDPVNEEIILKDFDFIPDLYLQDWKYNDITLTFEKV